MALQGFKTTVKIGGAAVTLTSAPMSVYSTAARTYQVTSAAQRVFSTTAAVTFKSSSYTLVANDIASVNYLFGAVTLTSSFTGGANYKGPPKATGKYIPLSVVAGAHSYKLNQSATLLDVTDYTSTGFVMRQSALRDVDLSIDRFDTLDITFHNSLKNDTKVLIDVRPGGVGDAARGWFYVSSRNQSGDVNSVEAADLDLKLASTPGIAPWSWGTP
jgi:hypothetical protein